MIESKTLPQMISEEAKVEIDTFMSILIKYFLISLNKLEIQIFEQSQRRMLDCSRFELDCLLFDFFFSDSNWIIFFKLSRIAVRFELDYYTWTRQFETESLNCMIEILRSISDSLTSQVMALFPDISKLFSLKLYLEMCCF